MKCPHCPMRKTCSKAKGHSPFCYMWFYLLLAAILIGFPTYVMLFDPQLLF